MATDNKPPTYDGTTSSSATQSFETLTKGGLQQLTAEQLATLKMLVNQQVSASRGAET
ncbi:hypothetical protein ACIGHF_00995 [Stenotrophomonas sp. NPDC077464]|uniref:hypothetical protein n=1 Tax=unclassified Stenotrophomonas TaxID=196198 RepID=UPI0037D20749